MPHRSRQLRAALSLAGSCVLALVVLATPAAAQDLFQAKADDYKTAVEALEGTALKALADQGQKDIEAHEEKIGELEQALADAPEDGKEAAQQAVDEAKAGLETALDNFQVLVDTLADKDVDVADYRAFLTGMGRITAGNITDVKAAGKLLATWTEKGKDFLVAYGPTFIVRVILFLLILLAFKVLAGICGRVTEGALKTSRLKISDLLRSFFVNIVTKVTFLVGLLIGLSVLGVPIGPFLAGIGVLGFVVGFALQDTLGNFASGIMILLYRPYDVGDAVSAGGVTGKVTSMSLVSTTFLTPDNQVQVVPNSGIWGNVITNITANSTRRVDLTVGIGYDDDIDHAEKVIMDVLVNHPKVLKDPAPAVKVNNLGESSVDLAVRPWSKTADYWDVFWDLNKALKQRLDSEKISIPYPQRDVHVFNTGKGLEANA